MVLLQASAEGMLFMIALAVFGGIALLGLLYFIVTRWIVNVGSSEIVITERRFSGKRLPAGRAFAANGEVGIQAAYLAPGLHVIPWPFMRVVGKFSSSRSPRMNSV